MRSYMFVPSKAKMLGKIREMNADSYIIDLEDSINEKEKEEALLEVCSFLELNGQDNIYIRVDGNWLIEELEALKRYSFRGYMIPKFENPKNYDDCSRFFFDREIIALVETPMGIVNIKEIAQSPIVSKIAFGAEDYTSVIGMKNCAESLLYARSLIVAHGKAYQKQVIDTPSFIINDREALRSEIETAVNLGFDGKLAIHPSQISEINTIFQSYDLETIISIVNQYDMEGKAVLKIGDKVYEKMHINHFKRIIKEQSNR